MHRKITITFPDISRMDWKSKRPAVVWRLADSTTDVGEYLGLLIEEDMEHMPPCRAPLEVMPEWNQEGNPISPERQLEPTSTISEVASRGAMFPQPTKLEKQQRTNNRKKGGRTETGERKDSSQQKRSKRDPRLKTVAKGKGNEGKRSQTGQPEPVTDKNQPGDGMEGHDTPTEEEMMNWSIRRLKGYLSQADQHAYGLKITLVQRLRQFFIKNPEKMRQMMEVNDPQGSQPKLATAPAREPNEEQSGQEPYEPRHDEEKNGRTTKAAEGLRQRKVRQQYWEDKLLRYMEYLLNNNDTEAWITDVHWLRLPIKVREARRATKEYEQGLKRFENTDDPVVASRKPEILECGRCGTVFIESEDLRDTLEAHKISQCAEFTLIRIQTFWESRNMV